MAQIDQRSLYASPFPFDTPLDAITDLFHQRAPVNCVRMRRHAESKDFRGSVFVEFADEAAAQKVPCVYKHHLSQAFLQSPILIHILCLRLQMTPCGYNYSQLLVMLRILVLG